MAQYYGKLTFIGEQISVGEVTLRWKAQEDRTYDSSLEPVSPPACPLYWVTAKTPPQGQPLCKSKCLADPNDSVMGNVFMTETDVPSKGPGAIAFSRFYDSGDPGADGVPGWRHSYDRSIVAVYSNPSAYWPGQSSTVSPQYSTPSAACTSGFLAVQPAVSAWAKATASYSNGNCTLAVNATPVATLTIYSYPVPVPAATPTEYDLVRDDGRTLRYAMQGSHVMKPPGISVRLRVTGSGFTVTDEDHNVETYDSTGRLQSIVSRGGVVQTVSYTAGLFSGVRDSLGNSLSVTRNSQNSIKSVTLVGGGIVSYIYNSALQLSQVTNLDLTTRSYTYDPRFRNALTSITDEDNEVVATWTYDSQERGTQTHLAGGMGR